MTPNLSTHRGTIEAGGDGDWSADWSVYLETDNLVEFGVRLNGGGVGMIGGQSAGRGTPSVQMLAPVSLEEDDYLELVARTNTGQTANIDIYTAHFFWVRELP